MTAEEDTGVKAIEQQLILGLMLIHSCQSLDVESKAINYSLIWVSVILDVNPLFVYLFFQCTNLSF